MKLTVAEKSAFKNIISEYIFNELVLSMRGYIQHGNVTTYEHCVNVALVSFWINRRLKLNSNEKTLVTGALLHDFYLYDWHEKSDSHKLHGFTHSSVAADNAEKYFNVSPKIKRVIYTHMWPLNITKIPSCREGWILCFADKYCALKEVFADKVGDSFDNQ